ncbi:ATPase synthesis protein 25 mitochondrial [Aspergillus brasiliensis]|uniref:ATPase synthesis protein 25 n=1 Tax=Aspergillus brasiliensis TaxID=319629 RepID=A0A9W5YK09_9EURO|nr:ATPase synthesis protein 25 mitochondrial [Aspergillus brasiliensis]GKZ41767.1 ATPase synthesis protein 25 mitochondrial [Aspergillus brasiliensis]
MNRALLRAAWSSRTVLRAPPSVSRAAVYRSTIHPVNRSFASVSCLRSEQPSSSSSAVPPESAELKEESTGSSASESTPHIPWYLQEEAPLAESERKSSRDQIPELPENPPAILPALLDYVFKDIGLDELKLIDLRGLETPPALGANVIMIIGTARSVKHLNVSADRLCRWLRSTYKLSPYADGLLGRNELKIKLRRKARRARLASRSGTMFDEKDDGITTGWICVNAGVVEETPVKKDENYTFEGFGHTATGTRIVVQMFTEEKRAEVDLESLWQKALERSERAKQRLSQVNPGAPSEEVRASYSINISPSDRELGHASRFPTSPLFGQKRLLHTDHRPISQNFDRAAIHAEDTEKTLDSQPSSLLPDHTHSDHGKPTRSMDALFDHLSRLSDVQARIELGAGPEDHDSTLFLRLFHDLLSVSSAEEKAIARLVLFCNAISRQHPGYTKRRLYAAFTECTCAGYTVSDDLAFTVVSALLSPRLAGTSSEDVAGQVPEADQELALLVLEHLSLRGTNVVNMRVFNMIYQAAAISPSTTVPKGANDKSALSRVSRLIDTLDLPFEPEQARSLMLALFKHGDYDGFWKLWRKLPLNGSLRTAADYKMLFRLHADLGDELRARDCISTWIPMMRREDNPIPLEGELLVDIKRCLMLADPDIVQKAAESSTSNLVRFWNACQMKMLK